MTLAHVDSACISPSRPERLHTTTPAYTRYDSGAFDEAQTDAFEILHVYLELGPT